MTSLRRLSLLLLNKFNNWFVSDGGVWQTLLVCLAVVVLEQIFPRVDPNHFAVLYVLTVYSGVTQPALARAGRVAGEQQQQLLERIEALEEQNAEILGHLTAIRSEQ